MTDDWERRMRDAIWRWTADEPSVSLEQWRRACLARPDRLGAWERLPRRKRWLITARARITAAARFIDYLLGGGPRW